MKVCALPLIHSALCCSYAISVFVFLLQVTDDVIEDLGDQKR